MRAFVIAALSLFSVETTGAQDLNGLFTSSTHFASSSSEQSDTDLKSFGQTLDLNWNKTISPTLRYRVTLRSDDARSQNRVNGDLTKSSATQFEPVLDVTLASAPFSLNGGVTARELFTDGNKQEKIQLSERRWFTRFFVNPENLPSVSLQLDHFTQANDLRPKTVNQSDTRYQLSSDYTYQDFTFSTLISNRINEDLVRDQTREQQTYLGAVGYTRNAVWGWLDVLGDYSIDYSPTQNTFSRTGIAEVERRLRRGFKAAVDLTPTDSTDVPLTNEPAIITGGALIPLELNTSVGFEQLISQAVSEIRLNLSPQPPFTLPENLELFLRFRVFSTNDTTLRTWTEVPGVSLDFEQLESRVRLGFSPTTARFFKVYVTRNDFGGLIRTTRISALHLEPVTAGTKRDESVLLHNLNGSLTARPATRPFSISSLSYDFSLSNLTQEPNSLQNTNGTHTGRLVAEPHRLLTSILTYQHGFTNTNQSGSKDTSADLLSLVFSSNPLPTLTSSLTLSHNDTRADRKLETRSDLGSFNVSSRLYRNLNVDSTYSISRIEDFLTDQKLLTHAAVFNADADLTRRLNATLAYGISWAQLDSPDQNSSRLTHTIAGSYTYTYSRFLNVNARYDFLKGTDVTAFGQDYRLDWTPTPKLSAFFAYRRTEQQSNGDKTGTQSVNLNGRWSLSRHLSFDTNIIVFKNLEGNKLFSVSGRAQIRF